MANKEFVVVALKPEMNYIDPVFVKGGYYDESQAKKVKEAFLTINPTHNPDNIYIVEMST